MIKREAKTTPALSDNTIIKYLAKLFKLKSLEGFHKREDGLRHLTSCEFLYIPEGLDEECQFIHERINVRGEMWTLRSNSRLAMLATEIGDQSYFLVSDGNMTGVDSLFLCTSMYCDSPREAARDLAELTGSWMGRGVPKIIVSGCKYKGEDAGYLYVYAAQLKSLIE